MVALWCAQDSPEARPPMSVVVKMMEGGVEIKPPPKPFHYLFSIGMNAVKPIAGSSFSSSEESDFYSYTETTPIMAKLGSGASGVVYRGQFPSGVKIAVKVLEKRSKRVAMKEDAMKL
ncbi:hypothetical protein SLEP1_g59846 [Rubroshorea leprosula]|uniref:Protein kinase domain-containing protein n=1 Tax=Rubroshorea leprosula TaxID=152421 RepID=A0AAV5MW32_9ROSI|nr:hypothetical protein SLEP1_g59846 [Rubroshorea leprosula]